MPHHRVIPQPLVVSPTVNPLRTTGPARPAGRNQILEVARSRINKALQSPQALKDVDLQYLFSSATVKTLRPLLEQLVLNLHEPGVLGNLDVGIKAELCAALDYEHDSDHLNLAKLILLSTKGPELSHLKRKIDSSGRKTSMIEILDWMDPIDVEEILQHINSEELASRAEHGSKKIVFDSCIAGEENGLDALLVLERCSSEAPIAFLHGKETTPVSESYRKALFKVIQRNSMLRNPQDIHLLRKLYPFSTIMVVSTDFDLCAMAEEFKDDSGVHFLLYVEDLDSVKLPAPYVPWKSVSDIMYWASENDFSPRVARPSLSFEISSPKPKT